MLSRNRPVAFVVGVAGFIGSHIAEKLLEQEIQVFGVDDFSTGHSENLNECIKHKDFHLIKGSIGEVIKEGRLKIQTFPRIDYVFIALSLNSKLLLLENFEPLIDFIIEAKDLFHQKIETKRKMTLPKTLLISDLALYNKTNLTPAQRVLSQAEVALAKASKEYDLNARVVRLAPVYGQRMIFNNADPLIRLLQAYLTNTITNNEEVHDFSTRAIYIDDATELIIKILMSGGTTNKIYDGALLHPLNIQDVKNLLLDPVWFELKGYELAKLPPWHSPNLLKTMREFSWIPSDEILSNLKQTITFFKDKSTRKVEPAVEESRFNFFTPKRRFIDYPQEEDAGDEEVAAESTIATEEVEKRGEGSKRSLAGMLVTLFFVGVIILGLVLPIFELGRDLFYLSNFINKSVSNYEAGKLPEALSFSREGIKSLDDLENKISFLSIFTRLGIFPSQIQGFQKNLLVTKESLLGVHYGLLGFDKLVQSTQAISAQSKESPLQLYQSAQADLEESHKNINISLLSLDSKEDKLLTFNQSSWIERLKQFSILIDKARTTAQLLPRITAVDSKKVYLMLLQDNLELRPTGGVIKSYARIELDKGKISNIVFHPISELDNSIAESYDPPTELKSDAGLTKWLIKDANFDPDFPSSAKQIEFFYNKAQPERLNGVIVLDLYTVADLLEVTGELDLKQYGEKINKENLFRKVIEYHSKEQQGAGGAANAFMDAVFKETFNKMLFLTDTNWAGVVNSIDKNLAQKHILMYFDDNQLLTFTSAQSWTGILPREAKRGEDKLQDLLFIVDSNMGGNLVNYHIDRSLKLDTTLGQDGVVNHSLKITYKNNSPTKDYPMGSYKDRIRIYVPVGAKLTEAFVDEELKTSEFLPFSDHTRSAYSYLLEVGPQEEKTVKLDYSLPSAISYLDQKASYTLDILKQPGTASDPLEWTFNYPENIMLEDSQLSSDRSLTIKTNIATDKSYIFKLKQSP